jgi:hypothetical protein
MTHLLHARRAILALVCVVGLLTVALAMRGPGGKEPGSPQSTSSPPSPTSEHSDATASDESLRQRVIGTWKDDYQGKRTMTLAADGTGTMIVELGGVKAVLVASRLEFDMRWSVAGRKLCKRSLGGRPETQVAMILKTMGDSTEEPILELTDRRLVLLDRDGRTRYEWRRAETQR